MKNSLLIIGAGGHGRVIADVAQLCGLWDRIAFVDDLYPEFMDSCGWSIVGKISDLSSLVTQWDEVVVGIGNNILRLELQAKAKEIGFRIATVIHPSAKLSKKSEIGEGSVLFANSVINIGSKLGKACIINTAGTIDHDTIIGNGVHVSPGANLAGDVKVGHRAWIGIGSSVVNEINIGADVVIGAGSVVINNIMENVTVVGNPAKILKNG